MRRRSASLLTLLVLVGGLLAVYLNRTALYDAYRLRGYSPPSDVAALATADTMTDTARHAYYVNHPVVSTKIAFNGQCPNNGGEQSIVLGCYHGGQRGIYLLGVNEAQLDGVEQVTAAHEMLHAAYDRLSSDRRKQVDAMLQDYFDNGLHDDRVRQTIEGYKKTEPTELVNEMHSIFGTEVADLPQPLEDYYKQYFSNRAAVTGFAARYQAAFTSRRQLIGSYEAQLKSLKQQIDDNQNDLQAQQSAIRSQRDKLESLRSSGNVSAYNAAVPAYNGSIDSYNNEVRTTQGLINQYNTVVADRNRVALEQNKLADDLNANVQTIQN